MFIDKCVYEKIEYRNGKWPILDGIGRLYRITLFFGRFLSTKIVLEKICATCKIFDVETKSLRCLNELIDSIESIDLAFNFLREKNRLKRDWRDYIKYNIKI